MANHSSSNNSERPPSAFQWPIPSASSDITIKEILDNYQHDPELLKLVLSAKAEDDKVWQLKHSSGRSKNITIETNSAEHSAD